MTTDTATVARKLTWTHIESRPADGSRNWETRWTTKQPERVALRRLAAIAEGEWDGMILRVTQYDKGSLVEGSNPTRILAVRYGQRQA